MVEAAQRHYLDGARFFESGQLDAALVEFEAAFRLSGGERDLLHNLSWTHEKAGRVREAIGYAERYLKACAGNGDDEARARRRVEFLRRTYPESVETAKPPETAKPETSKPETPKPETAQPIAIGRGAGKVPRGSWALLGAGGAVLFAGVGLLGGAWATGQGLRDGPAVTWEEWNDAATRGRNLDAAGIALSVVGSAAVLAGGTWAIWAVKRRTERPEIVD